MCCNIFSLIKLFRKNELIKDHRLANLVFVTWALTVLSKCLQSLVDEIGVVLVDVETKQS